MNEEKDRHIFVFSVTLSIENDNWTHHINTIYNNNIWLEKQRSLNIQFRNSLLHYHKLLPRQPYINSIILQYSCTEGTPLIIGKFLSSSSLKKKVVHPCVTFSWLNGRSFSGSGFWQTTKSVGQIPLNNIVEFD